MHNLNTYECPCRWDSPLINLQLNDTLPAEEIRKAIFEVAAPVPNQSTINVRLENISSSLVFNWINTTTKDLLVAYIFKSFKKKLSTLLWTKIVYLLSKSTINYFNFNQLSIIFCLLINFFITILIWTHMSTAKLSVHFWFIIIRKWHFACEIKQL